MTAADQRWLTPLPLWTGILTGPIVWAIDLTTSSSSVTWVCRADRPGLLPLITLVSLVVVGGAAALSWAALVRTANDAPTDGGRPRQRARFMALTGLGTCALFAIQILAAAIPPWVLDACQ